MRREKEKDAAGKPKAGAVLGLIYRISEVLLLKLITSVRKI